MIVLVGFCHEAGAYGSIGNAWRDTYDASCQDLKNATGVVDCRLCHAVDSDALNPYGADLQFIKNDQGLITWSAVFSASEGEDSDGDSVINIDEINLCTFPGDETDFVPNAGYSWGAVKALFR
jgi:hypothetical protein